MNDRRDRPAVPDRSRAAAAESTRRSRRRKRCMRRSRATATPPLLRQRSHSFETGAGRTERPERSIRAAGTPARFATSDTASPTASVSAPASVRCSRGPADTALGRRIAARPRLWRPAPTTPALPKPPPPPRSGNRARSRSPVRRAGRHGVSSPFQALSRAANTFETASANRAQLRSPARSCFRPSTVRR